MQWLMVDYQLINGIAGIIKAYAVALAAWHRSAAAAAAASRSIGGARHQQQSKMVWRGINMAV